MTVIKIFMYLITYKINVVLDLWYSVHCIWGGYTSSQIAQVVLENSYSQEYSTKLFSFCSNFGLGDVFSY